MNNVMLKSQKLFQSYDFDPQLLKAGALASGPFTSTPLPARACSGCSFLLSSPQFLRIFTAFHGVSAIFGPFPPRRPRKSRFKSYFKAVRPSK